MSKKPSLEGKVALITGASRGIGAAVAKKFAALGAHVILVARTVGALEEVDDEIQADGGSATLVPMDLKDLDRIDQLAAEVAERFGKLDILVGNAGILGELRPLDSTTNEIWDDVMAINVTANFRLIRAFNPLLRKSESGRVIFVTSGVAREPFAYWGGAYAASKAALEMLAKVYAEETEKTNIQVNLVDPGVVATNMRAQAMPGEDPGTLATPDEVADIFVKLATSNIASRKVLQNA